MSHAGVQLTLNIALLWQAVCSAKHTSVIILYCLVVLAALKLPLGDCVTGCYAQLVILLKTVVAVYQQGFVKQCFLLLLQNMRILVKIVYSL